MNRFIFISFFLLNSFAATAFVKDSLSVIIENENVVRKQFSEGLSDKYSGRDFDYDKIEEIGRAHV